MTALLDRIGFEVDAIDVFCGFGGSSDGIHKAGATVRVAANHSELALECHAKNFPHTEHLQADLVSSSDPQVLNRKGKKVPGRYVDPAHLPRARFAWFSPACTHHSQANALKVYEKGLQLSMLEDEDWDEQAFVNSERSRVTMSCVLRYANAAHPEIVVIENVVEVTKWGPGRDGSSFRWWMNELRKLGYDVQPCWFNSMFFAPCPQSRDRVYIVAHRKGNTAPNLDYRPTAYCTSDTCGGRIVEARQTWKPRTSAWVTDTWGKYGDQYRYTCPDCRSIVHPASWMALSAIDFTNLGPTLEEKIAKGKRPAENTWERIRRAVEKYRYAPPVILPSGPVNAEQVTVAHGETVSIDSARRQVDSRNRSIADQLHTLTRKNNLGIVTSTVPVVIRNYGGGDGYDRMEHGTLPLGTLTTRGTQQSVLAIVVPNRTNNAGRHGSEQLAPLMAGTVSQGVVVAAAGNTSERPGQTRARPIADQLFTQSTTAEFALAAMPVLRGDHFEDAHVGEQVRTLAANGNHQAIVTAMFSKINGGPGDTAWHGIDDPLNTITGRDTTGLVVVPWIEQWESNPIQVTEQLATITARLRHTLASVEPSEEPITDEMLMQVRFRMLEPDPELRRAMAFGDDYILLGNKGQMTAGLGNAVTPPVAGWITEQCLATLR